jgi:GTP-binding protein Era
VGGPGNASNAEKMKSGFVSIIGRPNSGKSTLLNRLVGEKVSIVTDKPQTTRHMVRGIVTTPEGQIVFVDTPGVHKPIHRMNERMMKSVGQAINDADLVVLIVDCSVPFGRGDEFTLELVKSAKTKKFLLLNKIDLISKKNLLPTIDRYARAANFDEVIPISALTGDNVETFLKEILRYLPEGPMFYPSDQISDQQERSIASEMIREKVILLTEEELPYSTAVVIDRFEEDGNLYRIYASIYVERDSQKGIVIGKRGDKLKEIGTTARKDLESFFNRKIFLELHVKVKKGWRDDDGTLRVLGLGE